MTNRSIKKTKMPRTPKQFEELREERKKAILDAALHVFAQDGYHGASISSVSKKAGISKGLMYNYFVNKEELLQILIGSLFDEETKIMTSILEQPFNESSLIALVKLGTETLKKNPKQWQLYFTMSTQPEVLAIVDKKYSPEKGMFAKNMLQFFKDKGVEDPMLQMHYFGMTMTGFKINYIMNPSNCPIGELETLIIKQFIKQDYVSDKNK